MLSFWLTGGGASRAQQMADMRHFCLIDGFGPQASATAEKPL
jgi:hypothetical protein